MDERKRIWYQQGYDAFCEGKRALDSPWLDSRTHPKKNPSVTDAEVANDVRRQMALNYWNAGWMDAFADESDRASMAVRKPQGPVRTRKLKARKIDVG